MPASIELARYLPRLRRACLALTSAACSWASSASLTGTGMGLPFSFSDGQADGHAACGRDFDPHARGVLAGFETGACDRGDVGAEGVHTDPRRGVADRLAPASERLPHPDHRLDGEGHVGFRDPADDVR